MKKLVILGAGTAGTIMLNKFAPVLDRDAWHITIVDQHETHYYQPGFLFIPFGIYTRRDVLQAMADNASRVNEAIVRQTLNEFTLP